MSRIDLERKKLMIHDININIISFYTLPFNSIIFYGKDSDFETPPSKYTKTTAKFFFKIQSISIININI